MQWLIFDAVGTLIAPREPVAVTYQTVAANHGSQLTIDAIRDRFRDALARSELLSFVTPGKPVDGLTTSEPAERIRWKWVVAQVVTDVAGSALDAAFTELWEYYAKPAAWRVLPHAELTLQTLRQRGWKLGVASNFDQRLIMVLSEIKELPTFGAVFISSRVGWRKPAPEFYRHVIERCGVEPAGICFVGDHLEHDFTAPKTAGMSALLLDPQAMTDNAERVRSLGELVKRVGAPAR